LFRAPHGSWSNRNDEPSATGVGQVAERDEVRQRPLVNTRSRAMLRGPIRFVLKNNPAEAACCAITMQPKFEELNAT